MPKYYGIGQNAMQCNEGAPRILIAVHALPAISGELF